MSGVGCFSPAKAKYPQCETRQVLRGEPSLLCNWGVGFEEGGRGPEVGEECAGAALVCCGCCQWVPVGS